MKKYKYIVSIVLLLLVVSSASAQRVSNDNEDGVYKVDRMSSRAFVPGEVLVKFKDAYPVQVRRVKGRYQSVSQNAVNAVLQEFGTTEMEQLLPKQNPRRAMRRAKAYNGETIVEKDLSQLYSVRISSLRPDSVRLLIDRLKALPEVEYAEPNYKAYIMGEPAEADVICENPSQNPLYSQQWGPAFCGVDKLWSKPIINAKRPIIAILDTGVDISHPDLAPNIWTNTQESEGEDGYDDDNDGFVDDVHGWDFVNNSPKMADYNSHGTHVAGIAAAADNGVGIVGANPMALIMPITVMQSDGSGDVRTIVKGIEYAVEHGATVINMSLGMAVYSQVLREALEHAYQTAVLVAAAGNDGKDIGKLVIYPAAHSFVLGVEAIDENGNRASFSNFDPDGPIFSDVKTYGDEEGCNYEIKAPGTDIFSTIPNGNYKKMNGTSMATPLVAGAVSALQMVKQYENQELLWADLLHSGNNFETAYSMSEQQTEIELLSLEWMDAEGKTVDGSELDAGGTFYLYPVVRSTWGKVNNMRFHLSVGDYEDESVIDIVNNDVDFGQNLSLFAHATSLNPIVIKIAPNVADSRHIRLLLSISCDGLNDPINKELVVIASNMIKIGGIIEHDMTLTADHVYHVLSNIGIPEGITLTIEPGTRLEFDTHIGMSISGHLCAHGEPEKPITFALHGDATWWSDYWSGISSGNSLTTDTVSYCVFENFLSLIDLHKEDCIIKEASLSYGGTLHDGKRINYINNIGLEAQTFIGNFYEFKYCNVIHNTLSNVESLPKWSGMDSLNYFDNYTNRARNNEIEKFYSLGIDTSTPEVDVSETPSYLGTSREDYIRPFIWENGNASGTYGTLDLSNMLTEPVREAHGIVWKVIVNGYDAQDEYDQLPPLGVGKHKFEIYFNRPMNKEVTPKVSFGIRDPYTQHAVDEDGCWNEEGTIYTVYTTITGKTGSDGVNRVYVYGAEDNEFFECPYENTRFNINIQAAGSLASGFMATPGMGRVNLQWNNENNDFSDAMGFNIYRYIYHEEQQYAQDEYGSMIWDDETNDWKMETVQVADTMRLNTDMVDIETTSYTDYDVQPGITYYYFYCVLSTALQEYDVSNVVSATPQTATRGDANGNGDVDVADVITTVGYVTGQEPKPFIFEAADMNQDRQINIFDVVSIIQAILNPEAPALTMAENSAIYSVEDGVLYVDSPVSLAGIQVQLNLGESINIEVAEDLQGFEHASSWLSDNDYLFLAYSMSGKTLTAGKHALLYIGEAQVNTLRLSDAQGHNVTAVAGSNTTAVTRMGSDVMNVKGIYTLGGQKLSGNASDLKKLPKGIYIINGEKIVK